MWFWISFFIVTLLGLIVLAYWTLRSSRRYEQKRLREVLSEEMQLVLRNERTENRLKKDQFEKLLKESDDARIHLPEGRERPD